MVGGLAYISTVGRRTDLPRGKTGWPPSGEIADLPWGETDQRTKVRLSDPPLSDPPYRAGHRGEKLT